jgi:HPr kinase/phosphorylase
MSFRGKPKYVDSISVEDFFLTARKQLQLELISGESGLKTRITDKSLNRPALALTGYYKNFASQRIQVFGAGEMSYLRDIKEDQQYRVMSEIARIQIPCIVITRDLGATRAIKQVAKENNIPLFTTPQTTRDFANTATLLLEDMFAPKVTEHGTLMDIKGIGTLIRGASGLGKSECALALIERGHSLVADDAVYIRLIAEKELMGTSSTLNRGYMECRGLGIVNIAELFGVRSVRLEKAIDLVVTFFEWKPESVEDRTGLDQHYFEILGQQIPHILLSVKPGRDLARLVEVASMVQALKQLGHNSAAEFNDRLINYMTPEK